jgi:sarcosine oxidase subunit beta
VAGKIILCRCEDVTTRDVERAVATGFSDLEEVKRYTGFGTGPCQGKECLRAVALHLARANRTRAGRAVALHQPPAAGPHRAQVLREGRDTTKRNP